ncbi:MAG: hypothetical protein GY851_24710 [bacterium]|nr:hypothetical protein [bacterium]
MLGLCALVGLATLAAPTDAISRGDFAAWHDDFATTTVWTAQPGWLTNADPEARVSRDAQGACFEVVAPNRGMKWTRDIPPVAVADAPYLYVRYQAHNVDTGRDDYVVYLDDGVSAKECRPIRFSDAVADGEWQHVAVDVRAISTGSTIDAAAIQVQANTQGHAWLRVSDMRLTDAPPPDARLLGALAGPPPTPDREFPLEAQTWTAEPSWLSNPADTDHHQYNTNASGPRFSVTQPDRGMKWRTGHETPIALAGHAFLELRYRASNIRPHGDYALCLLGEGPDGSAYEEVVLGTDLRADGQWRTLVVPLGTAAERIPTASGMAVQLQAAGSAELELKALRLVARKSRSLFSDDVPHTAGGVFNGFRAVDLSKACNQRIAPVLDGLHMDGWPSADAITAFGVPFMLGEEAMALAATPMDRSQGTDLTIPVGGRADEVFMLLVTALKGQEAPVFRGGAFRRIADVDRFRLRLTYADGTVDECLPVNVGSGRFEITKGPQVVCAYADASRVLQTLTLHDNTDQGAFCVAAVTCQTARTRLFPAFAEDGPAKPLLRHVPADGTTPARIVATSDDEVLIEDAAVRARIGLKPGPVLLELQDKRGDHAFVSEPWALLSVIAGEDTSTEAMTSLKSLTIDSASAAFEAAYELAARPGVELRLRVEGAGNGQLRFSGELVNTGPNACDVSITWPQVGPAALGNAPDHLEYVFPSRGTIVARDDADLTARYSGLFPLQFMAAASAPEGVGLSLRTEDTTCIERSYRLRKRDQDLLLSVGYPKRAVSPGTTRPLADTVVAVTDGDWHSAFTDYRDWLRTWYRPVSPRKPWFREVFNFRQRFLHWLDPLYDPATGVIDLPRAVTEAQDAFGGLEYLHVFDWGNCGPHGRIYGRIGDYDPYDFIKGGRDNLAGVIADVRNSGILVGLYIEGYLLNEKGLLGQAHGEEWQLRKPDGTGARWPDSAEIFMCPGVEAWRDVQARTYAAKVRELNVDGMYIDQFGFTGPDKNCYSPDHGHPVPSYPVLTEQATTRAIRAAVDETKPGVAIYTEESPCDVTSQYQDGAFTYAMNHCRARGTAVPLNLFRFAVPDFKTFEILVCDKPMGPWATGVHWVFFNGEGIWLEGPGDDWFEPNTLAAIRKCHSILRDHRDAFTSHDPMPLVETLARGVAANHFPTDDKELWTLYNSRHSTFRGAVLRAPHREGWVWRDVWHDRAAEVVTKDGRDVVSATLGPHGVGCLVRMNTRSASDAPAG